MPNSPTTYNPLNKSVPANDRDCQKQFCSQTMEEVLSRSAMSRIHVCLVSAQPIPNLIPLRMDELRPKKVILLVSPDMKIQAERLERVVREWGIATEKTPISPYDLNSARETCLSLLAQYETDEIMLNVTGGTKIMAFAAFEVFRQMGRPILYVDTQDQRVDLLSPTLGTVPFKSVIKVRNYLAAYGQQILSAEDHTKISSAHRHVIEAIVADVPAVERGISILNKYASPYRSSRTFPLEIEIEQHDMADERFQEVLTLFAQNGIITIRGNAVTFPSLSSVEFASGGWLEEHAYRIVSSLNPTDAKIGVKIRWDSNRSGAPDNEYDVVFTVNNRLYLVECKTKRFRGNDVENAGEDAVYKLETLREAAGGLYGRAMLVSYRRLSDQQKRRLAANSLEYCDGPNLKNLRERIAKWTK